MQALIEGGVRGALLGVVTDAPLCEEAHALGEGAEFTAHFNRVETTVYSDAFCAPAKVLALHSGQGVGRRGQLAGCSFKLGPSALLQIEGIQVVVISNRHQCHEPMFFEMFGVDIADARTVIVKSRGHFRAAFDEFFTPEQIVNVDAPGLTSPILSRFDFKRLPRPVVPLDPETQWTPAVRLLDKAGGKTV